MKVVVINNIIKSHQKLMEIIKIVTGKSEINTKVKSYKKLRGDKYNCKKKTKKKESQVNQCYRKKS